MKKVVNILKMLLFTEASREGRSLGVILKYIIAHIRFVFQRQFVFKWVNGTKLWAVHHRYSSTACYYFGMYDYSEMNFLSKYIREGDVFVDIGSNIGSNVQASVAKHSTKSQIWQENNCPQYSSW